MHWYFFMSVKSLIYFYRLFFSTKSLENTANDVNSTLVSVDWLNSKLRLKINCWGYNLFIRQPFSRILRLPWQNNNGFEQPYQSKSMNSLICLKFPWEFDWKKITKNFIMFCRNMTKLGIMVLKRNTGLSSNTVFKLNRTCQYCAKLENITFVKYVQICSCDFSFVGL